MFARRVYIWKLALGSLLLQTGPAPDCVSTWRDHEANVGVRHNCQVRLSLLPMRFGSGDSGGWDTLPAC